MKCDRASAADRATDTRTSAFNFIVSYSPVFNRLQMLNTITTQEIVLIIKTMVLACGHTSVLDSVERSKGPDPLRNNIHVITF